MKQQTPKRNNLSISACQLKWIGLITMLIDHVGLILFPQFWFLDIIGRISFPIFAFTTAVGFMYTRNVPRYGLRLFACAVISEPFFDLALFGTPFYLGRQNVLFTLALGVLMLYLWLCFDNLVFQCLSLLMVLLAAEMFRVDYSSMGLLMILFFYCFYTENLKRDLTVAAVNVLLMGRSQMFAVLALIPIHLYHG